MKGNISIIPKKRVYNNQQKQVWNDEHYMKIKKAVRGRLGLFAVEELFFPSLAFLSLFDLGSSDADFFLKTHKQYQKLIHR